MEHILFLFQCTDVGSLERHSEESLSSISCCSMVHACTNAFASPRQQTLGWNGLSFFLSLAVVCLLQEVVPLLQCLSMQHQVRCLADCFLVSVSLSGWMSGGKIGATHQASPLLLLSLTQGGGVSVIQHVIDSIQVRTFFWCCPASFSFVQLLLVLQDALPRSDRPCFHVDVNVGWLVQNVLDPVSHVVKPVQVQSHQSNGD